MDRSPLSANRLNINHMADDETTLQVLKTRDIASGGSRSEAAQMPPGATMVAVHRRRVTRRATLSGLAAVGLTGLTRRTDAAPPPVFGVVIPNSSAQFYNRLLQGMGEEAKSLGVELRIEESSFDPKSEAEKIHQFVNLKADGVLVVPLGSVDPVANGGAENAERAGARVAAVLWRIPGASVTVRPDWARAGALQAQIAMSIALRSGPAKGTFLYIAPNYVDPAIIPAFREALAKNDFRVILVALDVFERDIAVGAIAKALASYPDVSIIVASNDELARWAVEVAGEANRPIMAIGLGGSAEDLQATKLFATVDLKPEVQGREALRGLASVVRSKVCDNGQNPPCPEELIQPEAIIAKR
jgi:ABC-type sugar transport system substrate-binding protein